MPKVKVRRFNIKSVHPGRIVRRTTIEVRSARTPKRGRALRAQRPMRRR